MRFESFLVWTQEGAVYPSTHGLHSFHAILLKSLLILSDGTAEKSQMRLVPEKRSYFIKYKYLWWFAGVFIHSLMSAQAERNTRSFICFVSFANFSPLRFGANNKNEIKEMKAINKRPASAVNQIYLSPEFSGSTDVLMSLPEYQPMRALWMTPCCRMLRDAKSWRGINYFSTCCDVSLK